MNQETIICSNCKTPNPAHNLYCQSCGRPLIPAGPSNPANNMTQPSSYPPSGQGYVEPSPPAQSYTPPQPPPPQYYPPSQETYAPPPQQPYPPPPVQQQYPPVPPAGGAPVNPQQGVPPTYSALPAYQSAPAGPDFFQKTQAKAGSFVNSMKKETFSVQVDGWSDLVAGEAEKAAEIEQNFVDDFNARGLSYVDLGRVEISSGLQLRAYQVARHQAGSVAVYANPAGKDLMFGWDLKVAQKVSWKRIGILALAAVIISFLVSLFSGSPFLYFLEQWINGMIGWAFNVAILGLIAGKVMKGDIWYMFIEKPEAAALQELSALAMAVHQSLLAAVKKAGLEEASLRVKETFKTA